MSSSPMKHLDRWSLAVIFLTLILFLAALLIKGLPHELLLETGVFLVSTKLVIMAHKSSVQGEELQQRLDGLQDILRQIADGAGDK